MTLGEQKDDMFNRIREVFKIGRVLREVRRAPRSATCMPRAISGSLVAFEGGDVATAKDIAMHIVASSPLAVNKEDLPAAEVEKERTFLTEQARKEGKPENIIPKMIEGRLKNFYAARVLPEQPFVKDQEQTVAALLKSKGMKVTNFVNWKLGKG